MFVLFVVLFVCCAVKKKERMLQAWQSKKESVVKLKKETNKAKQAEFEAKKELDRLQAERDRASERYALPCLHIVGNLG